MANFSFGKNWKRYVKYIANEEILETAQNSLVRFFEKEAMNFSFGTNDKEIQNLKDSIESKIAQNSSTAFPFSRYTFLDIGCGSGLFSVAALRLGADVISFDYDQNSVEATKMMGEKFAHLLKGQNAKRWDLSQGSILDKQKVDEIKQKLSALGKPVIAYAWGVLHHTGNLELAMKNVQEILSQNYATSCEIESSKNIELDKNTKNEHAATQREREREREREKPLRADLDSISAQRDLDNFCQTDISCQTEQFICHSEPPCHSERSEESKTINFSKDSIKSDGFLDSSLRAPHSAQNDKEMTAARSIAQNSTSQSAKNKFSTNTNLPNYAFISLYNKTEASTWWLKIKEFYNRTNIFVKAAMVGAYTAFLTEEDIRKGRGLNLYDKKRGMHKITDVIDWLGGLPYEPIENERTIEIWQNAKFSCVNNTPAVYHHATYPQKQPKRLFVFLKVVGLGCNEFLFKREF